LLRRRLLAYPPQPGRGGRLGLARGASYARAAAAGQGNWAPSWPGQLSYEWKDDAMTAPTVYPSADGLYRITDGLGVWPYRGQVAAVGVGHSPTLRRWDGDPHKSIGAWAILAIRRAIEDAGVEPAAVDGIVFDSGTTTGAFWPEGEPVPADFLAAFENTSDPFDGLIQLSGEWLVKNLPELTGLKFVMVAAGCMS
jgi:hypothetical protein